MRVERHEMPPKREENACSRSERHAWCLGGQSSSTALGRAATLAGDSSSSKGEAGGYHLSNTKTHGKVPVQARCQILIQFVIYIVVTSTHLIPIIRQLSSTHPKNPTYMNTHRINPSDQACDASYSTSSWAPSPSSSPSPTVHATLHSAPGWVLQRACRFR